MELASAYLGSNMVSTVVQPACERIGDRTEQSCFAAVLDGYDIVMIAHSLHGRPDVLAPTIGLRRPAFNTAAGRAILSQLPDEALDAWLDKLEPKVMTDFTVTDKQALRAEILQVRKQGYAITAQELRRGYHAVAVPLSATTAPRSPRCASRSGSRIPRWARSPRSTWPPQEEPSAAAAALSFGPQRLETPRSAQACVRRRYLPTANGLSSPSQWRLSSGICRKAKTRVSGKLRNILLAIQVSVEKPRHMTSLIAGQHEEEQRPAHGELAPALVGELERRAEDRLQQRPLQQQQAAAQDDAEQAVHDGRLQLDEGLVLQPDREPAEHQHEEAADQRHDRPAPLHPAIAGQRDRGRDDEHAGADEDAPLGVGHEEQQQRPQLQRRRIELAHARSRA